MDYLSYIDKKDKNRRRKKSYAFIALFLLIPILLIAATFTNERIITKCEDIYHEKVIYEQVVTENEKIIDKCSHRVDSLSRLLGISTVDFQSATEEINVAQASNRALQDRIRSLEAALAAKDAKLNESAVLIAQLRKDNADKDDRIKQLNTSVQEKEGKISELESQLWVCQQEHNQAVREKESCEREKNSIREERDALKRANDQLAASGDRYRNLYEAEQKKMADLQAKYNKLKSDYDRCQSDLYQTQSKYDRLQQATPTVRIEEVNSIPGSNYMLIKRHQQYRVVVNGRVVRYLWAQWVD